MVTGDQTKGAAAHDKMLLYEGKKKYSSKTSVWKLRTVALAWNGDPFLSAQVLEGAVGDIEAVTNIHGRMAD
jgi:hypothetical protein